MMCSQQNRGTDSIILFAIVVGSRRIKNSSCKNRFHSCYYYLPVFSAGISTIQCKINNNSSLALQESLIQIFANAGFVIE